MGRRLALLVAGISAAGLVAVPSAALADGAPPTVTDVSPATQAVGTVAEIGVDGTGFAAGGTLNISGSGVTVTKVVVDNATHVSAKVAVTANSPSGTQHGPRTVTYTSPDGQTGSCATCFSVITPPTVTSVSPPSIGVGAANLTVTVSGSNFEPDATLSTSADPLITFSVVSVTATTVTAEANASPQTIDDVGNTYSLVVTNGDGGSAQTSFVVTADPTVKSQLVMVHAGTSVQLTVTGRDFQPGLTLSSGYARITYSPATDVTPTSFTTVVSARYVKPDHYRIFVTNPDGGKGNAVQIYVDNP